MYAVVKGLMPNYTLNEIMSFATANAGRRADITESTMSRLANEAYFEVFYSSDPQESESIAVSSTTTGENKIELPTDFNEPITATLIWRSGSTADSNHSSYQTLRLVDVEQMDGRSPQPSGTPTDIAFYNSWAELWPSPNSAFSFQLRYRAGATDMTELTDLPSVSTPWRSAIVKKTEENIYKFLNDEVGAQNAQMRYLDYVGRIKSDEAKRQNFRTRQNMTPSWGEGGRRRRRGKSGKWGSFASES